jgi:putative Holliday junction resolvase
MIYESVKDFAPVIKKGQPLICLDVGTVKIGIAISDRELIIASPYAVYERRNTRQDMGYLGKLAADENACAIVIGLPLQMNGEEGENCQIIRSFASQLFKKTNLPILLKDERFSTAAATRTLTEVGMTRKKRQGLDDKLAAGFVLEGVLSGIKNLEL